MGSDRCMADGIKEVRCDVCGLEIERGEIISKNGKSYHSRCFKGFMEQERESRRNALKVIGIGTAIAGATFIGADRLASAAYTRPMGGGGIYSSPFILPGLFSDPDHPEPGQVWYRMDKGVTAFHDGILNRNIYSDRNQYIITVSPKGIANGLSTIPNDGADFGPDTMLGATSPGQIGTPYTQTTGIQEAWNYAFASATTNFPDQHKTGAYWMKPIFLLDGWFNLNEQVVLDPQVPITNIKMIGSGMMSTYVYWNFNDHAIIINPSNINILGQAIEIGYMQPQPGGNVTGNVGFFATLYTPLDPGYQSNTFQSYDMNLATGNAYVFYLLGLQRIIFYNFQVYNSGPSSTSGGFHIENCAGSVYVMGAPHASSNYLDEAALLYMIGANDGNQLTIGNVGYVYLHEFSVCAGIQLLSNIPYIHIDNLALSCPYPFIVSLGSTPYTVDQIKIGELIQTSSYSTPFTGSGTGYTTANANLLEIGKYTLTGTGSISRVWTFTPTTPTVPASGTATANVNPYNVTVYLNGGSVTQVRVTQNGAEYMLFNSATGISMSGQGFKLGAGDAITLIYGAPPTWVWMI